MKTPIVLPDLGPANATFSLWYVLPGEDVTAGDRVAEVRIPGLTYDVAAPASGLMAERLAFPGDALVIGQTLGTIAG